MTIVKKLVELHKGTLEIESSKGEGTKVKLYFKASNKKNIKSDPTIKLKDGFILLVDDNDVNIKVTSTILKNAGYKVKHVKNGLEALEILDQEPFELILMDGEMPVMNGYEATIKIREGKCFKKFTKHKNIPIIALMANCDNESTIERAKLSGMDKYLDKTCSKKALLQLVGSYFN